MHSLRNLLVGTDFSACADAALDAAIAVALRGQARITVVHVCELTSALAGAGALDEEVIALCKARLDSLIAQRSGCGVELAPLMRIGRVVEKINNAAAEVGASLIVLGRSGADRAAELGSVTDRVLRTASRPLLIVCAKEAV
jgi:nucleotide-binding universal stress UspA family protein